jgi:hypothetical protein
MCVTQALDALEEQVQEERNRLKDLQILTDKEREDRVRDLSKELSAMQERAELLSRDAEREKAKAAEETRCLRADLSKERDKRVALEEDLMLERARKDAARREEEARVKAAEDELVKERARASSLSTALEDERARLRALQARLDSASAELAKKEEQIKALAVKMEAMERSNAESQARLNVAEAHARSLKAYIPGAGEEPRACTCGCCTCNGASSKSRGDVKEGDSAANLQEQIRLLTIQLDSTRDILSLQDQGMAKARAKADKEGGKNTAAGQALELLVDEWRKQVYVLSVKTRQQSFENEASHAKLSSEVRCSSVCVMHRYDIYSYIRVC